MALCTCRDVNFRYHGANEDQLKQLNLDIEEGEFLLICGQSGCGKTTLLRHLKPELKPHGVFTGSIQFQGKDIQDLPIQKSSTQIGYVMQHPDHQIVTDKVWHELAFGLENLGVPSSQIRRKTAEMAAFFGMEHWFHQTCDTLSGGQKQMLNLASIMVMQPKLLLLDEPTSQLDPIAASEFFAVLRKLNEEFGTTIVIVEHHLEELFAMADRIVVMDNARILCAENGRTITDALTKIQMNHPMFEAFPTAVRMYQHNPLTSTCPINVKEGKRYLQQYAVPSKAEMSSKKRSRIPYINIKNLYFRYQKDGDDILKNLSLNVEKQDLYMILGANGAGKSTLFHLLCAQYKPYRGEIVIDEHCIINHKRSTLFEQMAYVPQDPTTLFIKDSVKDDLDAMCCMQKNVAEAYTRMEHWVNALHLTPLLNQHPFDLSGGEQQRFALCKVLIRDISLLLMDEPTKGLDAFAKKELADILHQLRSTGITIVMVSHDVEFAASNATCTALLFDGEMISEEEPHVFFQTNQFYTTAASKMARNIIPNAITCEEVIEHVTKI